MAGAAFFDLDRTLMAGSSGMEFARVAARRGVVSRRVVSRWAIDHLRYRIEGASDEKTYEALKIARESVTGVPEREIARMWPEVLAGILPRIHPEVLAEAHRHQDEGREAWIVSAAGSVMVESLAAVLGMDGGIGTRYEVGRDGAYTGRFDGPFVYGPGKVEAIDRIAAERGLLLGDSWAYSDSVSDLPMLRMTGTAVAVNPDRPLREIAKTEGWEV
ncbi:MAG: HAD family hydrolase, partial [Solirubrobacterales bacterium]